MHYPQYVITLLLMLIINNIGGLITIEKNIKHLNSFPEIQMFYNYNPSKCRIINIENYGKFIIVDIDYNITNERDEIIPFQSSINYYADMNKVYSMFYKNKTRDCYYKKSNPMNVRLMNIMHVISERLNDFATLIITILLTLIINKIIWSKRTYIKKFYQYFESKKQPRQPIRPIHITLQEIPQKSCWRLF